MAIIRQAVEDVRCGTPAARMWFELPGTGLTFWSEVLGLDVEVVRRHALGAATTPKSSPAIGCRR